MTSNIIVAGFGGQGILFCGKQLAHVAMHMGKQITWLPSYGPEMRGGTANCSVVISDEEIGSPIVNSPDLLLVFNTPSLLKFEDSVAKGGQIFIDSALIDAKATRTDVNVHYIPATKLAMENSLTGFANVIMLGYVLKITKMFDYDEFEQNMVKTIPASKAKLIKPNCEALRLGYSYTE